LIVDFLYLRLLLGDQAEAFVDRFAFWWGAPYPMLVIFLAIAPVGAGALLARQR
jgi:hypothetical protein